MQSIDIVIPVYNEQEELEHNILTLQEFLKRSLTDWQWQIVIADNASTDKTPEIATGLASKYPEILNVRLSQKGRGRAIKKVWSASRADVVSYMDVDLSSQLKHFPSLINSLRNGYDIAIGSRLLSKSVVKGRTLKREITSRGYNLIIKLFFFTKFSDAQCGFKAVTKRVVKDVLPYLVDNEWFLDSELLIVGEKAGFRIYEEPVTWIDDPGSTVKVWKTAWGDIKGLWRLFQTKPWIRIKHNLDNCSRESKELIENRL
jgi:glycosyltransferase involved in cell wall biosynthesis